jgi:hypothetical protein
MATTKLKKRPNYFVKSTVYRPNLVEKTRNSNSVAQAFQPVLAQAKACGYIFNLLFERALQKPCRTLLPKTQTKKPKPC